MTGNGRAALDCAGRRERTREGPTSQVAVGLTKRGQFGEGRGGRGGGGGGLWAHGVGWWRNCHRGDGEIDDQARPRSSEVTVLPKTLRFIFHAQRRGKGGDRRTRGGIHDHPRWQRTTRFHPACPAPARCQCDAESGGLAARTHPTPHPPYIHILHALLCAAPTSEMGTNPRQRTVADAGVYPPPTKPHVPSRPTSRPAQTAPPSVRLYCTNAIASPGVSYRIRRYIVVCLLQVFAPPRREAVLQ